MKNIRSSREYFREDPGGVHFSEDPGGVYFSEDQR